MANQAWQVISPGELQLVDLGEPLPKPGDKQILIRLHAAALNYKDRLVVNHDPQYPIATKPMLVPCIDGAGVVEESGPGSAWKKGDRVVLHGTSWISGNDPRDFEVGSCAGAGSVDGTLRRYAVWDDDRVIATPTGLTMEEACTLFCAGVTAFRALFHGPVSLEPGMTVLVQGTGGVSCYAIQIASAAGATVVATSSSDEKLAVAKSLGAKHLINYRNTPEWGSEVLKVTGDKGVDIVVDVVGAGSIEQSIKATRYGGAVVSVGILSEDPSMKVDIMSDVLFGAKTLQGQLGAGSRDHLAELVRFVEKHQLHPQIAQTFDFEEADKALQALVELAAPGKVVVRI
ncbi:hypothetical protein KC318_g6316 [Hortaea werneckii]|nr:hypothetical protein KC334_g10041 [Hortaea werneckii]KAI7002441.1 hypothetical protein KC355_g9814 [Hortaea werneckii]KAI7187090.1 hypothetical protein KC324_g6977 [Hortaea werneckii]KAI7575056.1 hypothetical protein KC316_g11239 [Hortaea werneckii]KAI7666755.1 hypothetical protein KC318_g6316 [Hortaea werneckii]